MQDKKYLLNSLIGIALLLVLFSFLFIIHDAKRQKVGITGMAVGSFADCPQELDNLIANGNLECDTDGNGIPNNWTMYRNDTNHTLGLDSKNGRGNVLKSEFTGIGEDSAFGWRQTIYNIKPNTWYEFSVDFATEDVEPIILEDGRIKDTSYWIGAGVILFEIEGYWIKIDNTDSNIFAQAIELSDWNESQWVYKTYTKRSEDWKTYKKYFKTPNNIGLLQIATYNYPKGKIYFDNFRLKEVSENPEIARFKKSGNLNFVQYKGQDFFPIILNGAPSQDGVSMSLEEIKEKGFNTVTLKSVNQKESAKNLNLSVLIMLPDFYYRKGVSSSVDQVWFDNPDSWGVVYEGVENTQKRVLDWGNFENLLAFLAEDEINCHATARGSFLPELKTYKTIKENIKSNANNVFLAQYFCSAYSYNLKAYTGSYHDLATYYYPLADILIGGANLPMAYPSQYYDSVLDKVGIWTRNTIQSTGKPSLSRGLSVYLWQNWEGDHGYLNPDYSRVPFNLQRFQVWTQIINGATGVIFLYTDNRDFSDQYYNYNFQQIFTISKEVSSLYDVLLEPQFYDEWQVSDNKIEIMMKKHNGSAYLFASNAYYKDLQDVKITLQRNISSVVALNDFVTGDLDNVVDRRIITISGNSFTDNFIGDYNGPVGKNTPGYAVHIYKVEFGDIPSPFPENETNFTCRVAGFYCLSFENCSSDNRLPYSCNSGVCCSKLPTIINNTIITQQEKTCAEQNGKICNSTQYCNGTVGWASDGDCCLGECIVGGGITECKAKGNTCRETCLGNETQLNYYCNIGVCCGEEEKPSKNWFYGFIGGIVVAIIGVVSYIIYEVNKKREWGGTY